MPHGVCPLAQLLIVPSGGLPAARAGWPVGTGPEKVTGVAPVMRRFSGESTARQVPSTRDTATTDTPWAASALSTFSGVIGFGPSGKSRTWSTCSWLSTRSPRERPASPGAGKKCIPSWFMPICWACSAAVLEASFFQAGPEERMG